MTTFDQRDKRVETCVKVLSKVSFQFSSCRKYSRPLVKLNQISFERLNANQSNARKTFQIFPTENELVKFY